MARPDIATGSAVESVQSHRSFRRRQRRGAVQPDRNMLRRSTQCVRGGFPEQRTIGDRKATEFPEAAIGDDLRDG